MGVSTPYDETTFYIQIKRMIFIYSKRSCFDKSFLKDKKMII